MLDRFIEALTGRRLGGALFVLCGLIVAAVVLWPGGDGGDGTPPKLQPVRIVSVPELGIAFAHPRAWKRTIAGRVIRLRSPEGAAVLTFASPVRGSYTRQVARDLSLALRKRVGNAKVLRDGPAKLGARPARSVEIVGVGAGGEMRALLIVASSSYRTYAITLLTPALPSAKRLAEAQRILATVRLSEPTRKPVVASNG